MIHSVRIGFEIIPIKSLLIAVLIVKLISVNKAVVIRISCVFYNHHSNIAFCASIPTLGLLEVRSQSGHRLNNQSLL